MSFVLDLSKFTDKAVGNTEKVFRASSISLFRNVIRRTPVRSGRLKGNWQVDINQPATGEVDSSDQSPINTLDGGSARKVVAGVMPAKLDDSIFLVNNLPYARIIENGNYSDQAPSGMVGVSIAEFQREVDKQARKLK
jgi:hypothetical protein